MPKLQLKSIVLSGGIGVGAALALSACGSGGGSGRTSAATGNQLVIQPIRVCDNAGSNCAQMDFLEVITDKIWAQAGIEVTFLPPNQLNDSTYLSIAPGSGSNSEFSQLSFSGGAGAFGRHPSSTRTNGPINMWFVDVIEVGGGLVQYGTAWIGLNGVLISDDIYTFNGGIGRIDVIAHEVGHNLGLEHDTLGAGPANNLMSDGSNRAIPNSIGDIFPDGARLDQLNNSQIQVARRSGFLISAAGVASLLAAAPDQEPIAAADAAPSVAVTVADTQLHDRQKRHRVFVDRHSESAQVPEPNLSIGVCLLGMTGLGRIWLKRRQQSC